MILNTQTVTQEPLFSELSELSGGGDMRSLLQILVSRKYYMNFRSWLHNLYIIFPSWIRFCGPVFFYQPEIRFLGLSF